MCRVNRPNRPNRPKGKKGCVEFVNVATHLNLSYSANSTARANPIVPLMFTTWGATSGSGGSKTASRGG